MSRPELTTDLTADDFCDFYWLKAELVAFCRDHGLPTTGPRIDVAERIAVFLADGTVLKPKRPPRSIADPIPAVLTRETKIGRGWRCGQLVRAFFEAEVGPAFRFNRTLIDFIHTGEGRTLGEALAAWSESQTSDAQPIAPQLEYNAHTRAYYQKHPNATREEVVEAWRAKRSRRRSEWSLDADT